MRATQRAPVRFLRELRLPRDERAERRAEAAIRRERDNEHSAERRAAALEAEAVRDRGLFPYGQ